jgi:hypothetical protein
MGTAEISDRRVAARVKLAILEKTFAAERARRRPG